jgi:hypothetical protein
MRLACPLQRLDCLPIPEVKVNLNCRDEIIPILRALQQVYADVPVRCELFALVGKDINPDTSRKHGRRGLNYWEIMVLGAARLGCNLDYDKLQDLAENHRRLRQIMGIGDWQPDEVDFDWRRIEDNLTKLRPAGPCSSGERPRRGGRPGRGGQALRAAASGAHPVAHAGQEGSGPPPRYGPELPVPQDRRIGIQTA